MVAVACEQVWQEISNYIDGEISPALRSALDNHFGECQRCASVLEGTRNVVQLYGDDRLFQVPLGYSWRLKRRLHSDMRVRRRTVLAWLAASAAAAVISASVVWKNNEEPAQALRSPHSDPGSNVPRDLAVLVNVHGKLFHIPGCPFMSEHDPTKSLVAAEAIKEGYVPCPRCLGQYVNQIAEDRSHFLLGRANA